MAGIPIKMRAHAGLNHQKLVMLYGQHMSIFGSSNWTSSSDVSQEEHNCFCTDLTMFDWFTNMFDRKWNNSTGVTENSPFTPLPPNKPVNHSPANATERAFEQRRAQVVRRPVGAQVRRAHWHRSQ